MSSSMNTPPDPWASTADPGSDEPSPWQQRGFLASAAVVAVVVLLGVFLIVQNLTNEDDPAAEPKPSSPASTLTSSPDDPNASLCGLPGYEETGTLTIAPKVTWDLVGTQATPTSSTAGPGMIEPSGLRYCYAHTAEGALLAAIGSLAWGPVLVEDYRLIVDHNMAPGPGRDAAAAVFASASPAELEEAATRGSVQVRGFRVGSYTSSAALVDVAVSVSVTGGASSELRSTRIEVEWHQGDWRVRLSPDGRSSQQSQPLPSLDGFVPFSGV